MRYVKLPIIEDTFQKTLKDSYGQVWKKKDGEFSEVLPDDRYSFLENPHSSHFYKEKTKKTAITIHATAGILPADIGTLGQKNKKMSTHFVIGRNGIIYQLFDTDFWSYHLGSGASGGNTPMSKKTVSIELSNLCPLKKVGIKLVDIYGKDYCLLSDTDAYIEAKYRAYDYWATYTPKQIGSLAILVDAICEKHSITKKFLSDQMEWKLGEPAATIWGHQNVRKDKIDPGPAFDFNDLKG